MSEKAKKVKSSPLHVPTEIFLNVVDYLDNVRDINALVQINRLSYEALIKHLYRFDIKEHEGHLDDWTYWTHHDQPRLRPKVLFENQDRIDADASLYIGPDVNVDGNALYFAIRWNHVRTAETVIQNGSVVKSRELANFEWDGPISGDVKGSGVDIERGFFDYLTPLQIAVKYGRVAIVSLLIDHGADFRRKIFEDHPYECATPLHIASYLGDEEMVQLLLVNGADTEARSSERETPLFWAMTHHEKVPMRRPRDPTTKMVIVRLLLSYGANPRAEVYF